MKKIIIFAGLLVLFAAAAHAPVRSATDDRFAVCDQCGFCISPTPDSGGPIPFDPPKPNIEKCRQCLYPASSAYPSSPGAGSSFSTLKIDDATDTAPTPAPNHFYTMIGCISTNTEDFTKPGAAGGVVQPLLNLLFGASGGLAFIYLIYGAFILMTSQSEPDRINKGKRIIWGAIIGLIFVLCSLFIVNLVGNGILKLPGFGT